VTRVRADGSEREAVLSGLYNSGPNNAWKWFYWLRQPTPSPRASRDQKLPVDIGRDERARPGAGWIRHPRGLAATSGMPVKVSVCILVAVEAAQVDGSAVCFVEDHKGSPEQPLRG
jgi:hypothetical protein